MNWLLNRNLILKIKSLWTIKGKMKIETKSRNKWPIR